MGRVSKDRGLPPPAGPEAWKQDLNQRREQAHHSVRAEVGAKLGRVPRCAQDKDKLRSHFCC